MEKKLNEIYSNVFLHKWWNFDQFNDEIKESGEDVVAAILDVEGISSSDDTQGATSQTAFAKAWQQCQERKIPVVIYSGNVSGGHSADNPTFHALVDKSQQVDKTDMKRNHEDQLFCKLSPHIEAFVWKGYEYFYDTLLNNKFIDIDKENLDNLKKIIESYKDNTFKLTYKATMRNIVESMLDTLFGTRKKLFKHQTFKPNKGGVGSGRGKHNNDVGYIAEGCYRFQGSTELDHDNPYFPFAVCPRGVKNTLPFLWSILNNGLHNNRYSDQQKQKLDREHIESLVDFFDDDKVSFHYARAMYDSFFIVMHWYSIFMGKELYKQMPQE